VTRNYKYKTKNSPSMLATQLIFGSLAITPDTTVFEIQQPNYARKWGYLTVTIQPKAELVDKYKLLIILLFLKNDVYIIKEERNYSFWLNACKKKWKCYFFQFIHPFFKKHHCLEFRFGLYSSRFCPLTSK